MINVNAISGGTDIQMMQGSTFVCTFTIKDARNVAFDLTGFSVYAQFRKKWNSPTLIDCNITNGKIQIANDPSTGVFKLVLQPTDTSGINPTNVDDDSIDLLYDIELVSGDVPLIITRPTFGTFSILREITRSI